MAGLRSKTTVSIGSASWITNERSTALQFIQQEAEEFAFSARNEMDWLNEHMADIFAKAPITMTEIFKTPGKLRGKTPRTVRKRDALEARAPLTDVFAPSLNALTPARGQVVLEKSMQSAAAASSATKSQQAALGKNDQHHGSGKENTDSGYNASAESEFEFEPDGQNESTPMAAIGVFRGPVTTLRDPEPSVAGTPAAPNASEGEPTEDAPPSDRNTRREFLLAMQAMQTNTSPSRYDDQYDSPGRFPAPGVHSAEPSPAHDGHVTAMTPEGSPSRNHHVGEAPTRSPSDRSSPVQQVVRKSSLSFAALPAREPMAAKSSIGGRESSTSHLDHPPARRPGYYGTLARPLEPADMSDDDPAETESGTADDQMQVDAEEKDVAPTKDADELTETRLHRKTSTQRLHERISQLGQSQQPSRPTKSITAMVQQPPEKMALNGTYAADASRMSGKGQGGISQGQSADVEKWNSLQDWATSGDKASIHHMAGISAANDVVAHRDEEEDALDVDVPKPAVPAPSAHVEYNREGATATLNRKSAMTPAILSPLVVTAAPRAPDNQPAIPARTVLHEHGSDLHQNRPMTAVSALTKSSTEGPLSASKAKLSSLLKSARGIFVSSAGVSAQAKMETMSPSTMQLRSHANNAAIEVETETRAAEITVAETKAAEVPPAASVNAEQDEKTAEMEVPPSQVQEPVRPTRESKRPVRPGKVTAPKAKPVPVAIKVGTASQRELDQRKIKPSNTNVATSLQQSLGPGAAGPARPTLQSKPSAASLRKVTSNSTLKASTTTTTTKPRALAAAARKKEQEEREAQRKLEAKREAERKRATQQEEERKREQQRKEMEQQRQREQVTQAEDSKRLAQRQAIERRRQENAKKQQEQQKNGQMRTRAGAKNETAMSQVEKTQMHVPLARGELNAARPVSKLTAATNLRGLPEEANPSINHLPMNPARPSKRAAQPEDGDDKPHGPPMKVGPSYVQVEAKRRHTEDEDEGVGAGVGAGAARQAMPPPMRQSNLRKDALSKAGYTHGYVEGPSMSHKPTTTPQPYLPHQPHQQIKSSLAMDMTKFASAKIPFAEGSGNAGLPPASSNAAMSKPLPAPGPSRSQLAPPPSTSKQSSPHYRDGDGISLPDIPTDSEDEEEEDFAVPDWAQSPALKELLATQQLMDPEQIFGPIAPLQMEEIFKNNKDRHHRFRSRTSSANWSGADRLTQEEIQKDLEARRKLIANGEWTFGVSS